MRILTNLVLFSALLYCLVQAVPVVENEKTSGVIEKLEADEAKVDKKEIEIKKLEAEANAAKVDKKEIEKKKLEAEAEEVKVDKKEVEKKKLEAEAEEVKVDKKEVDGEKLEAKADENKRAFAFKTVGVKVGKKDVDEKKVEAEADQVKVEKKGVESEKLEMEADEDKVDKKEVEKKKLEAEADEDKVDKKDVEKKKLEAEADEDKVDKKEVEKKKFEREVSESSTVAPQVVEEPLNVSQWAQNPCESTKNFNYYQSYPNDTSRYIQCDPWGTGVVKTCQDGQVWNMWSLRCDLSENVRNLTFVTPQRVFNCSSVGFECMNGGVCTEGVALDEYRCVCRPEFTGQYCESRVDTNDLTHEILNGTFSLIEFRQRLAALNITSDAAQYERYRDQLDNQTYTELMNYISLYGRNDIRYDTLTNNLVEAILENIYPDAAYLSTFNASEINVVDLVRLIPNLMSYSRYSLERYQEVFAKYQSVLASLCQQLNSSEPRLRQEAVQYVRLTSIFMNQTITLMNQTYSNSGNVQALLEGQQQQHTQMNETQVRELLRVQFNSTLRSTERLYHGLESFQNDVMQHLQSGQEVYSWRLSDRRINGSAEVQQMLESISSSSVQIWDSLVNYGFWFVTSCLSTPASVIAQVESAIQQDLLSTTSTVASITTTTTVAVPSV